MIPGAARFGNYELLAHLATGGMAEIFLARMQGSSGFEKLVVVKRLLGKLAVEPEYVEMFLDEARINARLSHSNVVQCLELGLVDGKYFMAMEYVSGLSVAQVGKLATRRLGLVPQEVATGIVAQAAAGLHYAHDKRAADGSPLGIIHRDISPQNLIVTCEGIVKLVDFGIAKAEGRATSTRAGVIKGKFAYMSPEQCVGDPIDRRSDVFALGIVLFELCTSRRLFKRENTYRTYEAIAACEVPDPRSVNPAIAPRVVEVILRALQKSVDNRFQTAEEMQEALENAMQRSALRGTSTALAQFIERTFAPEIEQQQALVVAAEAGALLGKGALAAIGVVQIPGALTESDPDDEPTVAFDPNAAPEGDGDEDAEHTTLDGAPERPPDDDDALTSRGAALLSAALDGDEAEHTTESAPHGPDPIAALFEPISASRPAAASPPRGSPGRRAPVPPPPPKSTGVRLTRPYRSIPDAPPPRPAAPPAPPAPPSRAAPPAVPNSRPSPVRPPASIAPQQSPRPIPTDERAAMPVFKGAAASQGPPRPPLQDAALQQPIVPAPTPSPTYRLSPSAVTPPHGPPAEAPTRAVRLPEVLPFPWFALFIALIAALTLVGVLFARFARR